MKTKEDAKCSLETALAWAVSAKNSLQNCFGYSPNQLVLSRNITLPSVTTSKLPALDSRINSDVVRENLNAMHKARESYIKAESSEKIMRALRKNVRTYSEVEYIPGEKVYYKRKSKKGWSGPGKVLGKENNFVLIRHGGAFYRCHPCQLLKENPDVRDGEKANRFERQQDTEEQGAKQVQWIEDDSDSDDEVAEAPDSTEAAAPDEEQEVLGDPVEEATGQQENMEVQALTEQVTEPHERRENGVQGQVEKRAEGPKMTDNEKNGRPTAGIDESEQGVSSQQFKESDKGSSEDTKGGAQLQTNKKKPRNNTLIQYSLNNRKIYKARVLSTQPKRVGKWRGWVNVHVIGEKEARSVDWSRVQWWRELESETNQVLILSGVAENNQEVIAAKEKEYNNLVENDVFEWVEDTGEKAISTKWVITEKCNPDGTKRTKARLVARGFEEQLIDKRFDSPTASRQSLRLIFMAASAMEWELHSLDIASAFLQGKEIDRRVLVRPPDELMEEMAKLACMTKHYSSGMNVLNWLD
eukprot:gene21304-23381_t